MCRIGGPPDVDGASLQQILAPGRLLVRCAIRNLLNSALAPDLHTDFLALLAPRLLLVRRRPPVAPADFELRANDRLIEGRRVVAMLVADAVELARLLEPLVLRLCEREQLLVLQLLDGHSELGGLRREVAQLLERLTLHHRDDGRLRQLATAVTLALLHEDLLEERCEVLDGADGLVLARRPSSEVEAQWRRKQAQTQVQPHSGTSIFSMTRSIHGAATALVLATFVSCVEAPRGMRDTLDEMRMRPGWSTILDDGAQSAEGAASVALAAAAAAAAAVVTRIHDTGMNLH